jgi:hypothetical protein
MCEAGAGDGASRTPQKSKVKSQKHQNNANIHGQPSPELVSEECESIPTMMAAIATT